MKYAQAFAVGGLCAALALGLTVETRAQGAFPAQAAPGTLEVASPGSKVRFTVAVNASGRLVYTLSRDGKAVIEESQLGITVAGADLGQGTVLGAAARKAVDDPYPWRGAHTPAVNRYNEAVIAMTRGATAFSLEVRVFDDGAAFRYVVPGTGSRAVSGEATQFRLPAGTRVWTQNVSNGYYYEGRYSAGDIAALANGAAVVFPVTAELPGGGFAAITEGNLIDFPGLHVVYRGNRTFQGNFPQASWTLSGPIASPWRIVMAAADLDALVNCDIVHNVCPPPAADLAAADWIKPGLSSWAYLGSWGAANTPDLHKRYSRQAAELGFAYNLVDANWETTWPNAMATLKDLSAYARGFGIGTMIVKRYSEMLTSAERRAYFQQLKDAGAVGVKIDFVDSETRDAVNFYPACLKDAAEFRQLVNFHGANKPTGLERTWPNEVTREAIRGMEYHRTGAWDQGGIILPFTRMLAGHADYTPMNLTNRMGATSAAHQIGTVIAYVSPWQNLSEDPQNILAHPARDLIKSIPTTWDETRVLPPSKIGDLLVFARRKGTTWFVTALNGSTGGNRNVTLDLSFLPAGAYRLLSARDNLADAKTAQVDSAGVSGGASLSLQLRPLGGWAGRFVNPGAVTVLPPAPSAGPGSFTMAREGNSLRLHPVEGFAGGRLDVLTASGRRILSMSLRDPSPSGWLVTPAASGALLIRVPARGESRVERVVFP